MQNRNYIQARFPLPGKRFYTGFLIFIFCFFKSASILYGQAFSRGEQCENVFIHLDKQVYVAGEKLRYKASLTHSFSGGADSKILYFTLFNIQGAEVAHGRSNINMNQASGEFVIPDSISTGSYKLAAYSNAMRVLPSEKIPSTNLIILNFSEEIPDTLDLYARTEIDPMESGSDKQLKIKLAEDTVRKSGIVALDILFPDLVKNKVIADLSVSAELVSPFSQLNKDLIVSETFLSGQQEVDIIQNDPCRYKTEDMGFILSGILRKKTDHLPIKGQSVILARNDSIPHLVSALTDSSGLFTFYLPVSFDNKDLIIQPLVPWDYNDFEIELFKKSLDFIPGKIYTAVLTKEIKEYLKSIKDMRLIEAVYSETESKPKSKSEFQRPRHYLNPEIIVYPDEYIEMINFRDITSNLLPVLRFYQRNGTFHLEVLDPGSSGMKENSLILLNGIPYSDFAYLSLLGTKDIQRIEVVRSNLLLGNSVATGLVSVYTKDQKVPENYLNAKCSIYHNNILPADSITTGMTEECGVHFPDFRYNIYWNPSVELKTDKAVHLEFPASLNTGTYIIKVGGVSSEGQILVATATVVISE